MDSALLTARRTLTSAERELLRAACREIRSDHPDHLEIAQIVCDAILTVFGDEPFTEADWEKTRPVLQKIGHHAARRDVEPYDASHTRFRYERGFDLAFFGPAKAYVKRHYRGSTLAHFRCYYPLAVITFAWQVARFGADGVLLTSRALAARYTLAA
jgi:hypothetical protein